MDKMDHEDVILSSIADELILELCFEMHYIVKCGEMTLDDLYGLEPIEAGTDPIIEGPKETKKTNSSSQPNIVTCPVCFETVAGQRFAPHLEKCLNGGKRGGGPAKKASLNCSTNNMGIGLPYYTQVKKVDPYPLSLIIRVRLKDGVPRKNQMREGGLLSDFLSWQEIEKAANNMKLIPELVPVPMENHVMDLT